MQHGGAAIADRWYDRHPVFSQVPVWCSVVWRRCWHRKPGRPRQHSTTDNGKQNTYFSSLDNMVAQGNVLPVLYGEMRVGSRVVSQEISTADEGDGGQVVVIGR